MVSENSQPYGRKRRVCIYGGTDASANLARFLGRLTPAIIEGLNCVIVTGGVKRNTRLPKDRQRSVDLVVLRACKRYAKAKRIKLDSCLHAWIPDREFRTRDDIVRMSERDGVKIKVIKGRSDLGRRMQIVNDVDQLVTVKGKTHTETVLELALHENRPALPLPFSHGDSKRIWTKHKKDIKKWYPELNDETVRRLERFSPGESRSKDTEMSKLIVDVLASARFKCLVLMPFGKANLKRYERVIGPAIETEMCPDLLYDTVSNQPITENFEQSMRECLAIVADVTQPNPSVMYEIGYAKAHGLTPFLFRYRPKRQLKLPVYITQNVMDVENGRQLGENIQTYLRKTLNRD